MKRNLVLALTVAVACVGHAEEAPAGVGFRHNGRGTFPDANPPTEFSVEKNVLWKTKTEGWSNASPVVVGDRIFITEEPPGRWPYPNGILTCLSAGDGRILWRRTDHRLDDVFTGEELERFAVAKAAMEQMEKGVREARIAINSAKKGLVAEPEDDQIKLQLEQAQGEFERARQKLEDFRNAHRRFVVAATQPQAGYCSPTPVSDGRNVYVYFGNDVICSYDLEGNRRWAIRAGNGSEVHYHPCRSASPNIIDSKLIVQADMENIYAFDLDTGEELWSCPAQVEFASPAVGFVDGLPIVVGVWRGALIDARNGNLLANVEGMCSRVGTPVFDGDTLYVGERGRIWGATVWRLQRVKEGGRDSVAAEMLYQIVPMGEERFHANLASPLIWEGLLYRCSNEGALTVNEADTGELVYQQKLNLRKSIYTGPTLIGENVLVADERGKILIFQKGREYKQVAEIDFEPLRSCPVAIGDRLYIRGLEHLYCIGRE